MKTLALFLISLVLVTCVYAASPTISVKSKSKIKQSGVNFGRAINTSTGETLVSWLSDFNGVVGAILNGKGRVSGKPFYIVDSSHNDITCCFYGSSVTYNPVLQEYFAAYSPEKEGSFYAVRLDQHGKVKGKQITILQGLNPPKPNDLGDNSFPHIVFNPRTNGYIMIWERTEGIAAALLDENGKLTTPIKIIKKNPGSNGFYDDQRDPYGRIEDVQWQPSGKKLLVVFNQRSDDPAGRTMDVYYGLTDYWLVVLDPLLQKPAKVSKINTSPVTYVAGWSSNASLGVLPDDTACIFYPDNDVVRGRTISSKGKFSSAPFPAFSGSIDVSLHVPKVAFSTTSEGTAGLLIAYEFVLFGVVPQHAWAQVLDDHGRPAGQAKIVDTLVNDQASGAVLFALPRKPSDKLFQFIWMQSRGDSPAEILKLKLQVTP